MYRYKINDVEVGLEAGVRCRVEAQLTNREVKGARKVFVTFDFIEEDNWKQSTARFENGDGDEVSSIPTAAIGVLETAHKMAQQKAQDALREEA